MSASRTSLLSYAGPAYFKTARKCGIFGVACEGKSQQVNYLIDEDENPGKGADCTISLVHHYLEKYGCGEKNLQLHADNCTGQNKNNAVIHYLLWRVITGQHKAAQISFMLVGHTKFAPDRFFGLVKKRYRWSSVFFKSIPNILTYHSFTVDAARPGVVILREYSDTEGHAINILKVSAQDVCTAGLPNPTHIKGLDPQRKWYLYEQIRPFCMSNLTADFTCPLPTCPKPERQPTTSNLTHLEQPSPTTNKRKCSQCHQSGHTKRKCPGK